ncbi:MAG: phage/plasmid primase, P4 family [Elusimicrobiota bacterium]
MQMNEFEKEAEVPPEGLILERALACVEQGWAVFPVAPNAKTPLTKNGFKDASKSAFAVRKTFSRHKACNIGIATGEASGGVVLDIDVKNGAKGRESLGELRGLPPTLTVSTPSGGWHLYFRYPEGGLRSKNGILPGIDLKGDGGYVLAAGSSIDGKFYEYVDPEAPIAALPEAILARLRNSIGKSPKTKVSPVAEAISEGARNATLASLAGTLRRRGMEREEIEVALKAVNGRRCNPPLPEDEVAKVAASISHYPAGPEATLDPTQDGLDDDEPMPPGFTDDALALEFTEKHAEEWRFVAGWGHWLTWDGMRWAKEATLKAFDLARKICRAAASRCHEPKIAAKVASASTVAAVERLARADRRHAATVTQWDQNPTILNTPGGTADTKTGKLRPHDRSDYLTKMTAAVPQGEAPSWHAFLSDVTAGDGEMQAYLARMAGYCLTGVTTEHALFFLYGTGANGKSVFINTLAAVMGDYATNAPMDAFLESRTERHPTDLAGLMGARLVTAIEVDNGRRWAEAKIKSLTGGDKISARFMRQDFFEYTPQFKLLIAGNHKPSIRDVDEAMRRRLHLVPFTVTIAPERRDKMLAERLLAERNGILRWALDGCLEWQRIGLQPPPAVVDATEQYFEAEDILARWIEDLCAVNANAVCSTEELYQSWKAWAEKAGEYVTPLKKFAEDLAQRGFQRRNDGRRRGFRGIALRAAETQEEML